MANTLNLSQIRQKGSGDDVEKPFQCTKCDLRFTTNAARNIHSKTHKVDENFICKKCCFRTNDFKVFRKHRLDECSLKRHDCHKCNKSYSTLANLTYHLRSHKSQYFQCKECDFKTPFAGNLRRHLSSQHPSFGDLEFECADCDYKCASKDEIQMHIAEEHSLEDDDTSTIDDQIEVYDGSTQDDTIDDVFTCPLCDYLDPEAHNIEIHMQKVHVSELSEEINKNLMGEEQSLEDDYPYPLDDPPSDMFTCPLCDHLDTDAVKIEMHIREAHEVNMPFSCTECDFECFDHAELETHVSQEHGNGTDSELLSCTKCEFNSTSADDLENHIYDVHTRIKSELSCTLCDFTSNYNDELEKHIFDVHTAGLELSTTKDSGHSKVISQLFTVNKMNKLKQNKSKTIKKKISEGPHDFEPHTKTHKDVHQSDMKIQHKKSENGKRKPKEWIEEFYRNKGINWKCSTCDEHFLTKGGLSQHKTMKHGKLVCEECNIMYRTATGLQKHIAKEHSPTLSCPECDFKCTTEMDLRSHILVHEPKCQYMCPECEESYDDKEDLINHMLNMHHTGEKPYSCNECKEQFLTSAALNIHTKSHGLDTKYSAEERANYTAENNVCDTEINDQKVYIDNAEYVNDSSSIHDLKYLDDLENVDNLDYYDDSDCEKDINYVDKDKGSNNDNILQKYTNETSTTELNQENVNKESNVEVSDASTLDSAQGDVFTCPLCDYVDPDAANIEIHMQKVHVSELSEEMFTCPLCDYVDPDANNIEIHMQEVHVSELSEEINKNLIGEEQSFEDEQSKSQGTISMNNTQELECNKAKVKDTKLVWGFETNISDSDLTLVNDEINSDMRQNTARKKHHKGKSNKRKADDSFFGPALKKAMDKSEISMSDEDNLGTKETEEFENMEVLYTCNECDYVGTKQGLKDHSKTHKGKSSTKKNLDIEDMEVFYSCSKCEYVGPWNGLQVHSRSHENKSHIFSCDKCDYECFKQYTLEMHHKRHHSKQVAFNCSKCDFKCTSSNGMKVHVNTHAVKKTKEIKKKRIVAIPYMAEQSKSSQQNEVNDTNGYTNDSEASSSGDFAAPSASQGNPGGAKLQYQCKFCSYMSINRRGLSIHMCTVHGVKNIEQVLPRGTWMGVRQYACQLCDYQAPTSAEITAHFRSHIGDRPFGCPECSARFTKRSSMKIHEACHIEAKPYACIHEKCNYSTTLKLNLNTHYAKHRANERKLEKLNQQRKELGL